MEDSWGIFLQALPEILQALVGKRGRGVGGTIATVWLLLWQKDVDGSFEAWMKRLCHVSDMFQERKLKSFKFLCQLISEYDRQWS